MRPAALLLAAVFVAGCTTIYRAKVTAWDTGSLQSSAALVEKCLREMGFAPSADFPGAARVRDVSVPDTWEKRPIVVTVDFDDGAWAIRFVPPPKDTTSAEPTAHEFEGCVQRSGSSHSITLKGATGPDLR